MENFIRMIKIAKRNNCFLYWNNSFGWWVVKEKSIDNVGLELIHKF